MASGNCWASRLRLSALTVGVAVAGAVALCPAAASAAILHDQLDNAGSSGTDSTDYSSPGPGQNDREAADDFTVPSGQSWSIETVRVERAGTFEPVTFDIRFYADSTSLPGAEVASRLNLVPSSHTPPVLNLGAPVQLTAGTYWVSVQANSSSEPWLWASRSVTRGAPAAWRGVPPSGAGCIAGIGGEWFTRVEDCTMSGDPDQVFRLDGSPSTGATNPNVPSTTAPKKKCKKGKKLKKGKCVKKKRKKKK